MNYNGWEKGDINGTEFNIEVWEEEGVEHGRIKAKSHERYKYVYQWYTKKDGKWNFLVRTGNPYKRPWTHFTDLEPYAHENPD